MKTRTFANIATITHEQEIIGYIRKRGGEFVFYIPKTNHRVFRRSHAFDNSIGAAESAKKYLKKSYEIDAEIIPIHPAFNAHQTEV